MSSWNAFGGEKIWNLNMYNSGQNASSQMMIVWYVWKLPTATKQTKWWDCFLSVVMSLFLDLPLCFCSSLFSSVSVLNVNITFSFPVEENQSSTSLSNWTLLFGLFALTHIVEVLQSTLYNMFDHTWHVTSLTIIETQCVYIWSISFVDVSWWSSCVFFFWEANTHQVQPRAIHYHNVSLQSVQYYFCYQLTDNTEIWPCWLSRSRITLLANYSLLKQTAIWCLFCTNSDLSLSHQGHRLVWITQRWDFLWKLSAVCLWRYIMGQWEVSY